MTLYGNGEKLCQEAREHYYDYLCRGAKAVPLAIARHIESCSVCQEEIRWLGDMLREAEVSPQVSSEPGRDKVLEALNQQFEHLGEQVRCSHVKPFLPDLAVPSPAVRIPTPITVHVEQCEECAKDVAALKGLNLPAGQLKRFGEFLRCDTVDDGQPQAWERGATALADFSFDALKVEDLDLICRSPRIREWLYEQRAQAAAALEAQPGRNGVLRCDEVSAADLFDFVLPFGLGAETLRKSIGRRDAVGTHVRRCRSCLERVQSLHRTIFEIADRADSSISTVYRCQDADALSRYPIEVCVVLDQPEPAAEVQDSLGAQSWQWKGLRILSIAKSRLLARRSVSAAAIVLLVVGLSLMVNSARGRTFEDLRRKVRQARNVYMECYTQDGEEASWKLWVSGDLDKFAQWDRTHREVIDLKRRTRTFIEANGNYTPSLPLRADMMDALRYNLDRRLDLFQDVPSTDELTKSWDSTAARRLTYEVTKKVRTARGMEQCVWRGFVDPDRELPVEAQSERWDGREFRRTVIKLTYPTKAEMERTFKELAQPLWLE